jgi:exodeoxyribonuclease VII small subunit
MPKTPSSLPAAPVATASASPADSALSFESASSELDALIARMESGQMPLDELLQGYERGAQLLAVCRAKLAAVEQQIRRIDDKISAQGDVS